MTMYLVLSAFTFSPIYEHWFRKYKGTVVSHPRHGVQLNATHSRKKEITKKKSERRYSEMCGGENEHRLMGCYVGTFQCGRILCEGCVLEDLAQFETKFPIGIHVM